MKSSHKKLVKLILQILSVILMTIALIVGFMIIQGNDIVDDKMISIHWWSSVGTILLTTVTLAIKV